MCLQEMSEELDLKMKKYLRGGAANLEVCVKGCCFVFFEKYYIMYIECESIFSGSTR